MSGEKNPLGNSSVLGRLRNVFRPSEKTDANTVVENPLVHESLPSDDYAGVFRTRWQALKHLKLERRRDQRELGGLLKRIEALGDPLSSLLPSIDKATEEVLLWVREAPPPPARRVAFARNNPELAQALVRLANSPSYYTELPVTHLEQAVLRVGEGGFRSLVLKQLLPSIIGALSPPWTDQANLLSAHMRRTATLSRRLAPGFSVDPEEAFVAGLLHDVGKLLLIRTFSRIGVKRISDGVTREVLRVLHEPLGATVTASWGFSATIALAIATHHRDPLPSAIDPLGEIVFFADAADRAMEWRMPFDLNALFFEYDLGGSMEMAARAIAEPWTEDV